MCRKTEIEGHAEQLHVSANRQDQRLTMGVNDMRTVSTEKEERVYPHTHGESERPGCVTKVTSARVLHAAHQEACARARLDSIVKRHFRLSLQRRRG